MTSSFFFNPLAWLNDFEDDAGGQGAVADDSHRVSIGLAGQLVADFKPEGGRWSAAGVPGHEQVEGAFGRVGVTHQTPFGPDRVQHGGPAGDQFVGINLMAGVPDQAVLSEVEGQVQGQAELDHAEVAGEVRRPPSHDAD